MMNDDPGAPSAGTANLANPHLTAPPPPAPLVHIVFYEPRIAGNTGAAIRLAAATGARLHLIEPLGFDLSEAKLKRAGLDYHDLAVIDVHKNLTDCFAALPEARVFAFEVQASDNFVNVAYQQGDILLFGPEPTGIPEHVLNHPRITDRVRIPMLPGRRSLNLTNCASIAVYEAWRQLGFVYGT
ncbi:MAG: tRNA (cytidine(34)-2'-O)-methyltransferase [Cellulomonadaceae bacterium]|jgi:tRNA (cytidine/uridine-2'-O-)-methyltransferase|nr:tRNA (cytidine(34)-2'-O)-methyltransferase [Cellulomonadaceae bacterium]